MKKLLLASILATAGITSQAQVSNVSVYGVIDTSVQSYDTGAGRITRMQDSLWSTSRLGFRGSEDLGNGLSAVFQLEGQLNPSAGSMGSTTVAANEIFNRDSYVGLRSVRFGEVRLGRQDVAKVGEMDVAFTLPIAGNFALHPVNGTGVELGTDQKNAVSYLSPNFGGFQVIVGHATNANNATADANTDQNGVSVLYTRGPFKAGLGYQKNKAATTAAERDVYSGGASYDFGVVQVGLAHAEGDVSTTGKATGRVTTVAAKVPLANNYAVHGVVSQAIDGNKSSDNKGTGYAVIVTNALSKRTTLYAAYTAVDNQAQSSMRFFNATSAPVTAGQNTSGVAIGVNHSF